MRKIEASNQSGVNSSRRIFGSRYDNHNGFAITPHENEAKNIPDAVFNICGPQGCELTSSASGVLQIVATIQEQTFREEGRTPLKETNIQKIVDWYLNDPRGKKALKIASDLTLGENSRRTVNKRLAGKVAEDIVCDQYEQSLSENQTMLHGEFAREAIKIIFFPNATEKEEVQGYTFLNGEGAYTPDGVVVENNGREYKIAGIVEVKAGTHDEQKLKSQYKRFRQMRDEYPSFFTEDPRFVLLLPNASGFQRKAFAILENDDVLAPDINLISSNMLFNLVAEIRHWTDGETASLNDIRREIERKEARKSTQQTRKGQSVEKAMGHLKLAKHVPEEIFYVDLVSDTPTNGERLQRRIAFDPSTEAFAYNQDEIVTAPITDEERRKREQEMQKRDTEETTIYRSSLAYKYVTVRLGLPR